MTTTTGAQSGIGRDSLEELFTGSSSFVERLPMLRLVLEQLGPRCEEEMRALTAVPTRLVLQSLQTGVAGDLLGAQEGACLAAVLHAPLWGTRLLLCLRRATAVAVAEILLGGDAAEPDGAAEDRPLSRVETRMAGLFLDRIAGALAVSFAPVAETPFVVEAVAEAIDYDVIGKRNNSVVLAQYRLEAGRRAGEVLIAIPRSALVPMRHALSQVPAKEATTAPDPGWAQQIQTELERAGVALSGVLGEQMGLLGDVSNYRVGQVIELNITAHDRVRLECNGERLFWCHLGQSQGKYTLRVDEAVDREQEFMNEILTA